MEPRPMIRRSLAVPSLLSCFGFLLASACGSDDPERPPPATPVDGGASGEGGGGACVPRSCESSGVLCGVLDDGCGLRITCDAGCGEGGHGGAGACQPTTCAQERKNCGRISDGCGNPIDCGNCVNTDCGEELPNVCGCPPDSEVFETTPRTARIARSEGFAGSDDDYAELYAVSCEAAEDCAEACVDRGGEDAMCDESECLESASGSRDCLPPPVWSNLAGIQAESRDTSGAVQLVAVFTPYHDRLLTTDFELEVPENAVIRGLSVDVRRGSLGEVSDDSVRILKGGELGSAERASTLPWGEVLEWASYGGPTDLWGEEWTAADLNGDDFGLALSVVYADRAGNARAYVDQVRVNVHYSIDCGD